MQSMSPPLQHQQTDASVSWICPSCGSTAATLYCGNCGERRPVGTAPIEGSEAAPGPRASFMGRLRASLGALASPPGQLTASGPGVAWGAGSGTDADWAHRYALDELQEGRRNDMFRQADGVPGSVKLRPAQGATRNAKKRRPRRAALFHVAAREISRAARRCR